ncbi:MAG TPA: AAA family ATPase [Myxococcaceae bacterium]
MKNREADIRVLGPVQAKNAKGEYKPLERKTAALLAYLALERHASREKLIGLLWPDTKDQPKALNNLRQALFRLRRPLKVDYIQSDEFLKLREGTSVDVLELLAAYEARDYARVVTFTGELLEGFTYDDEDFTDLNEWLDHWRMKLRDIRLVAMEQEVLRPEREGRLLEALEKARQLSEWDRKLESPYRHVMRLLYRLGDRAAALKTYRQCVDMLQKDFDAGPSPETSQLARQIERVDPPLQKLAVPLSVVHPPVLVGREREWAQMEEAWAARQPMLVDGESGAGKSRLVSDFAQSRGKCLFINARPGDQDLPYSTHIRSLTELLDQQRDLPMEPWVRRELSRLLPGLQPDPLPPAESPEERSRLVSAIIALLRTALQGVDVIVFDDAQYLDRHSAELGIKVHSEFRSEMQAGRFPLIINIFRTSDAAGWKEMIQNVLKDGLMQRVTVNRLDIDAIRRMLEVMGAPELSAEKLMAYTGGNPLFIVELVRHLQRSGSTDGKLPDHLQPSERIRAIILQRLDPLSEEAKRLVRFFAVDRTDFSAELASKVLEVPVDQLAAPWKELEEAGLIQRKWFVHDLMAEVVLETVPEPIREELTRRIALHRPSR